MFASALKKMIFGIPEKITKASLPMDKPERIEPSDEDEPIAQTSELYLPESQVPPNGIFGVADDGSCWTKWRINAVSGEQWYRRLNGDTYYPQSSIEETCIHGISLPDDDSDKPIDIDDDRLHLEMVAEQKRQMDLMFRKHILRARQRELDNPFDIQPYQPDQRDDDDDDE